MSTRIYYSRDRFCEDARDILNPRHEIGVCLFLWRYETGVVWC